jgi:hypothetical protein
MPFCNRLLLRGLAFGEDIKCHLEGTSRRKGSPHRICRDRVQRSSVKMIKGGGGLVPQKSHKEWLMTPSIIVSKSTWINREIGCYMPKGLDILLVSITQLLGITARTSMCWFQAEIYGWFRHAYSGMIACSTPWYICPNYTLTQMYKAQMDYSNAGWNRRLAGLVEPLYGFSPSTSKCHQEGISVETSVLSQTPETSKGLQWA